MGYLGRLLFIVNGWWLVLAAIARLAIQITNHQPLDALPFISGALGATDDGVAFVARSGRRYHASSPAAALRYLKRHSVPCRLEDSPRCYWDASSAGNGVGESFAVIGGKRGGEGVVFYLALS